MTALQRLLSPRSIAVFGGRAAEEVIHQCRKLGFAGDIWPVHPGRAEMAGLPCHADVAALPAAPDAAFVAVPRHATVEVVGQLRARGAGGAICYASGFAEVGGEGLALQQALVAAAGEMALVGPNCYGLLNYLDGVALWPDQHGGERVQRGVAIITQSGNIGLNLTMQRRGLPLALLITVGNKAGDSIDALIDTLLQDERVSAIGLHLEGLDDVAAFSRVALAALRKKVPLVVLKAGSSELGARTTMSHTSSLAGPDTLYDALFQRLGVARVYDVGTLLETLKLLHVHSALPGNRIASASCSGGEASLVADLAWQHGLAMPALPPAAHATLLAVLGDKVTVANPLDYHTYIWGNLAAQTACFAGLMQSGCDACLLVLDFPRADRCDGSTWHTTLQAFATAKAQTGARAIVLSTLPEGLDDTLCTQLLQQGIAPMQGTADCMHAIALAAQIGHAQTRATNIQPVAGLTTNPVRPEPPHSVHLEPPHSVRPELVEGYRAQEVAVLAETGFDRLSPNGINTKQEEAVLAEPGLARLSPNGTNTKPFMLDEVSSKAALAAFGLPVPAGRCVALADVAAAARAIGFPVVVKAVSVTLAHKTEAGGVALNLHSEDAARAAAERMGHLADRFLVEAMTTGAVAEIMVGIQRDPQFGLTLTIGAGGILVELLQDAVTLLLPVSESDIENALQSLKTWPLLNAYRGRASGDVPALVRAIRAIAAYAQAHADHLEALDVNPLLVRPAGQGAVAVDALIYLTREPPA